MSERTPRRRTGLNLWLVLAVLPIFAFTCWFSLREDDSVAPSPPSATTSIAPQPPPSLVVETRDASVDTGQLDAGLDGGASDAGFDAGVTRAREPTAADVAAYVARWRAALEPILRNARPIDPIAINREADAGVSVRKRCIAGEHVLPMAPRNPLDLVVAVDTSGSMWGAGLDITADFIGRLEYQLVAQQTDYRLIVLAEPRVLKLTTDAGVTKASVQSHDGLDVLINTARDANPRWMQFVRDDSELRVLLITDDGPASGATEPDFTARLITAVSRTHTFSVLGGFKAKTALTQEQPIVRRERCQGSFNSKPMYGQDPGEVYQQVANVFGGVRASICDENSRDALLLVFAQPPERSMKCEWTLHPEVQLIDVRARDARGTEVFLVREPSVEGCPGLRHSYVLRKPLLAMCPETCAELKLRDMNEVKLRIECTK